VTTPDPRGRSFDAWAADYDRFRPGYPDALFDLIAGELGLPSRPDVADLGAGTGRAAIAMARRGWHVTAVEPGEGMLEALRSTANRLKVTIQAVQASAEDTTLEAASVDLATAAQAFHWFDPERSVAELARIVRPGGGVAIFWNSRDDDRSDFLAAYTDLLARSLPADMVERRVDRQQSDVPLILGASAAFGVRDRIELEHEETWTPDQFTGFAMTASYIQKGLEPKARDAFRAETRSLAEAHAVAGVLQVPFQLDLWLIDRTIASRS
jgi:SAM-dependent methyltransferase